MTGGYQQQKGTEYEHELGNSVHDATDGLLVPLAAGYTARHGDPADLIIDDGEAVHVFEIKRTAQDAYSFIYDEDDNDDIYGLMRFCKHYPRPTYPYLGIRFDNRQLVLIKLWVGDFGDVESTLSNAVKACPVSSKHTRADNFRVHKPDSSDWPSQGFDDAQYLLDTIGFSL